MKLNNILRSNHDLKKNGYRIIRKLRKMEKRKGADKAYGVVLGDSFCFVLYIKTLIEIIKAEYSEAELFIRRCERFLTYLEKIADNRQTINCSVLASFLHSYTVFFNQVIKDRRVFKFDRGMIELWNTKCLMAYIATWGENRRNS